MNNLETLRHNVNRLYTSGNPEADVWVDWAYPNHVLVVADLAERLAKAHGARVELAVAGALLHDVADAVMARKTPDHDLHSLRVAEEQLRLSGFDAADTAFILNEVIKPHSCKELVPTTLEGKVMASADGAAHFLRDFWPVFCWRHYGPQDDYEAFRAWVRMKIEKDYHKKLFFDDIRAEVRPHYEAIKLIFA